MAKEKEKDLFVGKSDPEQYQKCAVPFATAEEANAAVQAFWEDVYELRCKHNLANISFVIGDTIATLEVVGGFGEADRRPANCLVYLAH